MTRAEITHEQAARMRDRLLEIGEMSAEEQKGMVPAGNAAAHIYRFYQTQEHYRLAGKGPADYERSARNPLTAAGKLAALTPEELLALQAKAAADYPGKAKPA